MLLYSFRQNKQLKQQFMCIRDDARLLRLRTALNRNIAICRAMLSAFITKLLFSICQALLVVFASVLYLDTAVDYGFYEVSPSKSYL